MQLIVLGLNHKTAPVEVREGFNFSADRIARILRRLRNYDNLDEAVLLSTCNRTEFYMVLEEPVSGIRQCLFSSRPVLWQKTHFLQGASFSYSCGFRSPTRHASSCGHLRCKNRRPPHVNILYSSGPPYSICDAGKMHNS